MKKREIYRPDQMHWCDICKCWLQNKEQAKLNHERGANHQENLARKLRSMEKDAAYKRIQEERTQKSLEIIENRAQRQFARDKAEAKKAMGTWTWDSESSLYYQETYRWYFDEKTQYYYGGDPPEWIQEPPTSSLPREARFPSAATSTTAAAAAAVVSSSSLAASTNNGGSISIVSSSSNSDSTNLAKVQVGPAAAVKKYAHPMMNLGGYQAPLTGKIGGAKGTGAIQSENEKITITIGGGISNATSTFLASLATNATSSTSSSNSSHSSSSSTTAKRKLDEGAALSDSKKAKGQGGGGGKGVDKAEAEALARREAARRRVEERTKAAFGFS